MDLEELKDFVISKIAEEMSNGKRDVGHDKKHVLTGFASQKDFDGCRIIRSVAELPKALA